MGSGEDADHSCEFPEPRHCWSTVEKYGMMLIYLGCYCCLDTGIVMYIFSEQVVLSKKERSRCITCLENCKKSIQYIQHVQRK